jgi:hypothetical protein
MAMMLQGLEPPPPAPPVVWHGLCRFLDVTSAEEALMWHAMQRSTTPAVASWRLQLLLYDETKVQRHQVEAIVQRLASPRIVVDTLERLCTEGLLSRELANTLQSRILDLVDKEGAYLAYTRRRALYNAMVYA